MNDPLFLHAAGNLGVVLSVVLLRRADNLGTIPPTGNLEVEHQGQLEQLEALREENFNIRMRIMRNEGALTS